MAHKADYWERIRGWLIPKLGLVVQLLEDITGEYYYVESKTHNNQFVGRVNYGEEDFEKVLHDLGFERNPLASYKTLKSDPDNYEEGSFRKVGYDEHPDMQLHVILYDGSKMDEGEANHMYIYAHWEKRWDVHPWDHYRGYGFDAAEGVKRMKDLLDQHGIDYDLVRP